MNREGPNQREAEKLHHSLRCSVVIPTYNMKRFIGDAVQSVFQQTEQYIHLIIVDDGSTDGTEQYLKTLESHCPRDRCSLSIITQTNKGMSAARNAGIRASRSPYISFLDADDIWHPTMVETLANYLDRLPQIDIVHCGVRIVDEYGKDTEITGRIVPGEKDFEDVLLFRSLGQSSAVMVRRSVLETVGYFDETLYMQQDWDLWLRVAASGKDNILTIADTLVDYRWHSAQASRNWRKKLDAWKTVLAKAKERYPELVTPVEREAYARRLLTCAALARESGDRGAALTLIFQAWSKAFSKFALEAAAWRKTFGILLIWLPRPLFDALQRKAHTRMRFWF